MGVNCLPKTVTRQRRFEPGPYCALVQHANHSATEPTTNLPIGTLQRTDIYNGYMTVGRY